MRRSLGFRAWWVTAGLVLIVLAGGVPRAGAEGVVHSDVDSRRLGVQDQLQLTVTVQGSALPNQIDLPTLFNLRLIGGPSVSTQMSFVNGQTSQARSWTYLLQPLKVGRAEVGAVRVPIEGVAATAPPIVIEVIAGSTTPPAQTRRTFDPFEGFQRQPMPETRMFVEAKPSRTSLFVGEPLLLTYYIYIRTTITGLQFVEPPQFTGFWAEDLAQTNKPQGEPATVEGIAYQRFPVFTKLLVPTRAGRLTLPVSKFRIGVSPQSFFDTGSVIERATKPIAVQVKAIPEEPGYSGAVGRFRASASVDRSDLALGDAATLRFKVEGGGNLKWVDRGPDLTVDGAKVYPPQIKSDFHSTPAGITGSRTWEFVIVPQTAGTLEIPALAFSYFDPSTARIVHSTTAPIPLRVGGGAPGAGAPPLASMPRAVARGGPLRLRTELDGADRRSPRSPGRSSA